MPSPRGSTRRPAKAAAPQATPYVSPALEVLETLEIENALTNLEARLDSLEIDLARATGSREDDARRVAGEMAVMKARVEDALTAFAATADHLRQTVTGIEKRLSDLVVGEELDASVADVREELEAQIDAVGDQLAEVQKGITSIVARLDAMAPKVITLPDAEPKARSKS
jgi:predicted  nucleic acid-binding Zn-ribbon protein